MYTYMNICIYIYIYIHIHIIQTYNIYIYIYILPGRAEGFARKQRNERVAWEPSDRPYEISWRFHTGTLGAEEHCALHQEMDGRTDGRTDERNAFVHGQGCNNID